MKYLKKIYSFITETWTGSLLAVLFLINFVGQSYIIPSGSMKSTLEVGDFVIGNKMKYGIGTPYIPWIEVPIATDSDNNGHIIEGPRPENGDIVIFRYPKDTKVHFVKRSVAVPGDKLFIEDKHLYISFKDQELMNKYVSEGYETRTLKGLGTFIKNPYSKTKQIRHEPKINKELLSRYLTDQVMFNEEDRKQVQLAKSLLNFPNENSFGLGWDIVKSEEGILVVDVKEDQFFMLGDNRENSHDSRFWGPVNYKHVEGTPIFTWMSIDWDNKSIRFDNIGNIPE